jgi:hypothetical protein
MGFEGFRTGGTVERRVGRRAAADSLEVTWVVPRTGAFTLRRSPRLHPGPVENISFTGASILGPASLPLEVDGVTLVRFEGYDNSVIVRRREPTADPDVHRYGVELMVVHPALHRRISERVAAQAEPATEAPSSAGGSARAF